MRLDDERQSENIEDRRSQGGGFGFPGGGGPRIRVGGRRGGMGIGGIILLLALSYFMGVNPLEMIFGGGAGLSPTSRRDVSTRQIPGGAPANDAGKVFAAKVLHTTERTWSRIFQNELGKTYVKPTLVLFRGRVRSACGMASAAMGPFYCPGDRKVYLDLSFYDDMKRKLGASGDFAQAYVIAHEVGHHVQNLLGIAGKVAAARQRVSKARANALSVRMELQADCLAGVWGRDNRDILDAGDIEEALNAAAAIGDDRLQRRAQGYVVPESFTHGTSAQRVRWFKRGFESGSIRACDTFAADRL